MSQENVEKVRRGIDAFNAGDDDTALALYDPEVEIQTLLGHQYRGHDGFRAASAELRDTLIGPTMELDELIDAGDSVVCTLRLGGRGRSSGVEHPGGDLFAIAYAFRDGLVVAQRSFRSKDEALEALS